MKRAQWIPAPPLSELDLQELITLYEHRLTRRLIRRGYLRPTLEGVSASDQVFELYWGREPPSEEERKLLQCYAASTKLRHAFGPHAGQPLDLDQGDPPEGAEFSAGLCVKHGGFTIHAATVIEAEDRERLEYLCRYIQRPVIAQDRLNDLGDGRFYYAFKRTWRNGTKGIYFEGPDLLERLAALIPPPKRHQVRYHGAYAPNSRLQQAVKRLTVLAERALLKRERERRRVYWVLWAELLKRTFRVNVTRCPQCQGSMQVIAQLYMPEGIKALMPYDGGARGPPS